MKGNFHVRFLGGPERVTARAYPVRDMKSHEPLLSVVIRPDSALLFAAGIPGEQALDGRRKLLSRVWSLSDNVADLGASVWVRR